MNKYYLLLLAMFMQQSAIAMQKMFIKRLQQLENDYQKNKKELFKSSGTEKSQKMLNALDKIKPNFSSELKIASELEKKLQLALSISKLLNFQANGSITTRSDLYEIVDSTIPLNFGLLEREAPEVKILPAMHSVKTALIFHKLKNLPSPVSINPDALQLYESDSDGNSLLHVAVQADKLLEIETLLNIEEQLLQESEDDFNYLDEVTFLSNNPQGLLIEQTNKTGMTPLLFAATTGKTEALVILIERGANPNAQDTTGKTALHYAAASKNHLLLSVLVTQQININSIDCEGNTPLDILLSKHIFTTSDCDLCICLQMFKAKNAQLNKLKNDARAKLALSMNLQPAQPKAAAPRSKNKRKKSKTSKTQEPLVGADTKKDSETPQTEFDKMLRLNQLKKLESLIDNDYDYQINLDFENETTLHPILRAVSMNNIILSNKLVDIGSDLNFESHYAAKNPSLRLVADFESGPLLHYAYIMSPDDTRVLDELLRYKKAKLDTKNSRGETLIGLILRKNQNLSLVTYLLRQGAEYIDDKKIYKDDEEKKITIKGLKSGILHLKYNKKKGTLDFNYNTK